MKFFVKFEVYETIVGRDLVLAARQELGKTLERFQKSGKLADGAIFTDSRAGYFIIDVDTNEELFELFGEAVDFVRVETHPIASFEALQALFEKFAQPRAVHP